MQSFSRALCHLGDLNTYMAFHVLELQKQAVVSHQKVWSKDRKAKVALIKKSLPKDCTSNLFVCLLCKNRQDCLSTARILAQETSIPNFTTSPKISNIKQRKSESKDWVFKESEEELV